MARTFYGGSPADVIAKIAADDGDFEPATASMTAWNAASGGSQITDLQDANGSSITVVTPEAAPFPGRVRFFGPDGYTASIWLQDAGGNRWRIDPADLATRVSQSGAVNTDWSAITNKPATFAPAAHTHDDRYLTAAHVNLALANRDTAIAAKYTKPAGGIPMSDLSAEVIAAITTAVAHKLGDHTDVDTSNAGPGMFLTPQPEGHYAFQAPADDEVGIAVVEEGAVIPPPGTSGNTLVFETTAQSVDFGIRALGSAGATDVATVTYTLTAPVAVGELIVAAIGADATNSEQNTFVCTDSKGNTWTQGNSHIQGSTNQSAQNRCRVTTPLVVGDTITVTARNLANTANAVKNNLAMSLAVITNAATSGVVDRTATNGSTPSVTALNVGPTAATSQTQTVGVAAFVFNGSGRTFTPTSGWVLAGSVARSSGGAGQRAVAMVYRMSNTTEPITASGQLDVAGAYAATLSVYKAA